MALNLPNYLFIDKKNIHIPHLVEPVPEVSPGLLKTCVLESVAVFKQINDRMWFADEHCDFLISRHLLIFNK